MSAPSLPLSEPSTESLPPLQRQHDGLTTGQRRAMVGAIAGAHVLAVWGLLQVREVREAVAEVAPLFVSLVAPETPKPIEPPPPPPQPPKVQPKREAPLLAAAPTPSPAPPAFTVPPPPPEPVAAVVEAPTPPAPPAPPAPAPAPAPPPVLVMPSSAVQYVRQPAVVYPSMSKRQSEKGRVMLRVWIDEEGLPQRITVNKSSGFPRLDAAAVTAVEKALFKPYVHEGRVVGAWAFLPIDFELE